MIFTKEDAFTSDEIVGVLSREFNIYDIDFVGSLIYLLSTRVDLCFALQKLKTFHQILVKYILRVWYTCWYILRTKITWAWDNITRYRIPLFLTSWYRLWLILTTNWWFYLTPAARTVQIQAELQEHIFCFIKVGKLIIVHMLQVQLPNTVLKLSTIQYALK